ncbi:formylmethanofuran dehydrogenase subunit C [Phyllobacterium salinisoli]|uniref:Formylmethanofuran dehydrogenase subunit C n=1 Tax=Phyllobacterium salinisoli TaxID=1899321 RepID=A0A368K5G8_9HYPH|nr:formylmethanofuran dehydrogenase subunit C [Phyllobacterium salinisoli]RCS24434.1 formylmethanofuran dehydrogenase subunit C [Phyllobacterium salinisoli]
MKGLTFTLRAEPEERLDLLALTPDRLDGMSVAEIARLRIGTSRKPASVGDLFKIAGKDASRIVFDGGSAHFDGIGAGMSSGMVYVAGDAGAQAGRKMRGGAIVIEGRCGTHAGSCMAGGRLEIRGNSGDCLGGPLAGEMLGMAGGVLVVRGRAGDYAGDRMRRGVIAILKGCGDYAGSRMIAGSVAVRGKVGAMPGYLMKRGSLLFDRRPEALSPTFIDCGRTDIAFSGLFDRYLIEDGILDKPLLGRRPGKYGGDTAVLGKGEILFRMGG